MRVAVLYLMILGRHHLFAPWVLVIMGLMIADSLNTAWHAGWKARLVALVFPIEIAYSSVLTAAILSGYFKQITGAGSSDTWKRVRSLCRLIKDHRS
jgi:hypothetical protein